VMIEGIGTLHHAMCVCVCGGGRRHIGVSFYRDGIPKGLFEGRAGGGGGGGDYVWRGGGAV